MSHLNKTKRAFSLFELLVIIAVIAILLGLLLPAVQKTREEASRIKCSNNLKQIILAMHMMHDVHGTFPPAFGDFPNSHGTIFFHMLPYIEQDNLYKNAMVDGQGASVWNNETCSKTIPLYLCPLDATGSKDHLFHDWLGTSSYAANFLVFGTAPTRLTDITDGTSNTIACSERLQVCNDTPCGWGYSGGTEWAPVIGYSSVATFQVEPTPGQCNPALAQSAHPAGINVGMADGSVHYGHPAVSPQTWYCLLCPNDGIVIGNDW
jgi:prepilin-type processing-associated H-X9-DG protein